MFRINERQKAKLLDTVEKLEQDTEYVNVPQWIPTVERLLYMNVFLRGKSECI